MYVYAYIIDLKKTRRSIQIKYHMSCLHIKLHETHF
jgi:hypothetical protein